MTLYNLKLKRHYGLKWRKTDLMLPSPVWAGNKASNKQILCQIISVSLKLLVCSFAKF